VGAGDKNCTLVCGPDARGDRKGDPQDSGGGEPMDAGGIGNVVLTGGNGLPEGLGRAGTPAMPSMQFQFVHRDMLHTVPVFPEDHHLSITTPENSPVPW
jgi:hypothetical protein